MTQQVETIREPYPGNIKDLTLNVYDATHTFESVRAPFAASEYAELLINMRPRYSGHIRCPDERFVEIMGPDVNPFLHGPFQAETIALPMLRSQKAATGLRQLPRPLGDPFIAHHIQHDDHEGLYAQHTKTNADIAAHDKTDSIHDQEFQLWCSIHQELFPDTFADHYSLIEKFEGNSSKEEFPALFWRISEHAGYLATGFQAAHMANNSEDLSDAERAMCRSLAADVRRRQTGELEQARSQIAWVDDVLLKTTAIRDLIKCWEEA